MQRPGGYDDERPVAEVLQHRAEQGGVQAGGPGLDEVPGRRRPAGRSGSQGVAQRVDPVVEVIGKYQADQPGGPVTGHHHRALLAAHHQVLDKDRVAQRRAQRGHPQVVGAAPGGAELPRPVAHRPFEGRRPGPPVLGLRVGRAEPGGQFDEFRIRRRRQGQPGSGSPPPLGPLEDVGRVAPGEGDVQPGPGQATGVPGRRRPQLHSTQRGAVVVQHPQARPQRRPRPRASALGQPDQRLGVPGPGPELRRVVGAASGGPGERPPGRGWSALGQRQPGQGELEIDGDAPPAVTGQPAGAGRSYPSGLCGDRPGEHVGLHHEETGQRRPRRPALAQRCATRAQCGLARRRRVVGQQGRLRRQQHGLDGIGPIARRGELGLGPPRRGPGFRNQQGAEQGLGPLDRQQAGGPARRPVQRLGFVEQPECGR